ARMRRPAWPTPLPMPNVTRASGTNPQSPYPLTARLASAAVEKVPATPAAPNRNGAAGGKTNSEMPPSTRAPAAIQPPHSATQSATGASQRVMSPRKLSSSQSPRSSMWDLIVSHQLLDQTLSPAALMSLP